MPKRNKLTHTQHSDISYQNKDIFSKIFSENLKNKSLSVYGLQLPEIVDILPTNLPIIEANEMRLDNIFRLADNSLALIDYESIYRHKNKIKYLNYIVRTLKKNDLIDNIQKPLRMIVIYTGDVKRTQTDPHLDVGCLQFTIEEVFLSELDPVQIETTLTDKIKAGIPLSEEEQMQFIILPMIYPGKQAKQDCIRRCFDLARKIDSPETQRFLLSGILVFTDKVISKQDSEDIWRWIDMTKVGRIFEREKIEYARQETQKALAIANKEKQDALDRANKEKQDALDIARKEKQDALDIARKEKQAVLNRANREKQDALKDSSLAIARRMLKQGIPVTVIQCSIPDLTYNEIISLK